MAHGHLDPSHRGLQLGTQANLDRCGTGLGKRGAETLALALTLSLLKAKWDFSMAGQRELGPWKLRGLLPQK